MSESQKTLVLDCPFKRGEQEITEIVLQKPAGTGWLTGVSLLSLMQMDAAALRTVLPRITSPTLTEADLRIKVSAADLLQMGTEVASFLLPKSALASASPTE